MKIPEYQNTVGLDVPQVPSPQMPRVVPGAFGGDVAQATERLGAIGGQIGEKLAARAKERYDLDQDQIETQLYLQSDAYKQDLLFNNEPEEVVINGQKRTRTKGILNRSLADADGGTVEFRQKKEKHDFDLLNSVQDPETKTRLYKRLSMDTMATQEQVIKHETTQWNKNKENIFDTGIKVAQENAANARTTDELAIQIHNAKVAQGNKNKLLSFDSDTSELNIRSVVAGTIEKAITSSLNTDITGQSAKILLESAKADGEIDDNTYANFEKTIKDNSAKLIKESKELQKQTSLANEAQVSIDIANGKIPDSSQLIAWENSGFIRPEYATAAIKVLKNPRMEFSEDEDDDAFIENAKGIFASKNTEERNKNLINILDGFSSGNLSQKNMALLIKTAIEYAPVARQQAKDSLYSVMKWQEDAGIKDGKAVKEFIGLISNKINPQEAAQQTIANDVIRQSSTNAKEKILESDISDKVNGTQIIDNIQKSIYQYILKTGVASNDAAQVASQVMSETKDAKDKTDFLLKLNDSLNKNIPNLQFTSNIGKNIEKELYRQQIVQFISQDKSKFMENYRVDHPYAYTALATIQEAGAAGAAMLDGMLLGLPTHILNKYGYDMPRAPSGAGKALQGLGGLYGFIKGLPGKIAGATIGKLFLAPKVVKAIKGYGKAGTVATFSAKSASELGIMQASMTPRDGLIDLGDRGKQFLEGAKTGAAFGAFGFISSAKYPKITQALRMGISSLFTGVPSHLAGDTVEEQVFNFGLGLYFGRNGMDLNKIKEVKDEAIDLSKNMKDEKAKEAIDKTVAVLDALNEKDLKEKEPMDVLRQQQEESEFQKEDLRNKLISMQEGTQSAESQGKPEPPSTTVKVGLTAEQAVSQGMSAEEYVASKKIPDFVNFNIGDKKIEVIKNPTSNDYGYLNEKFSEKYPRALVDEPKTRFAYDVAGNRYEWMSDTTHDDVQRYFKNEFDLDINQNQSQLTSEWQAAKKSPTEEKVAKGGEIYYRGNMAKGQEGSYFTKDKEFARNFTQSGQDKEISQHIIPEDKIYKPETLPSANSEKEVDLAITEAKSKGFGAIEVSEGKGQPNSVFVFDKQILSKLSPEEGGGIESQLEILSEKAIRGEGADEADVNNAIEITKNQNLLPTEVEGAFWNNLTKVVEGGLSPKEGGGITPPPEKPTAVSPGGEEQSVTKVPRSQLPVGEGEQKASRLETRVKNVIESMPEEKKQEISNYNEMNKREQMRAAAEYVTENPEEAMQVLLGKKVAPEGLLHNSIALALEEHAKSTNDADLILKIASLRSTRAGQEISILTERDPNSPVKYLGELKQKKIESLGDKETIKERRNTEIKKVKESIAKNKPTQGDWIAFIESIKC